MHTLYHLILVHLCLYSKNIEDIWSVLAFKYEILNEIKLKKFFYK